jgi:hypothetical protein
VNYVVVPIKLRKLAPRGFALVPHEATSLRFDPLSANNSLRLCPLAKAQALSNSCGGTLLCTVSRKSSQGKTLDTPLLKNKEIKKGYLKCRTRKGRGKHPLSNCHAGTKQSQAQHQVVTTFMFCNGPPSPRFHLDLRRGFLLIMHDPIAISVNWKQTYFGMPA